MLQSPLPSLPAAFSRRRAILGVMAVAAAPGAMPAAQAGSGPSPSDARLVALLDAYKVADAAVSNYPDEEDGPVFDALIRRLSDIEDEMAMTPACTMAGVLAKARICQVPSLRSCMCDELTLSIADDLVRLHAEGGVNV